MLKFNIQKGALCERVYLKYLVRWLRSKFLQLYFKFFKFISKISNEFGIISDNK